MADSFASAADRELGLARIAEIRETHRLRPSADRQVDPHVAATQEPNPMHDAATCRHCLGVECFWCLHEGQPVETCTHTLSQRHGAPLEAPVRRQPEPVEETVAVEQAEAEDLEAEQGFEAALEDEVPLGEEP